MSVSFEEFGRLQTQMLQLRQENYELKEQVKRLKLDASKKPAIDEKKPAVSMQNIFKTEKKKLEEKSAHEQEIEHLKECLRRSEEMSEERNTQVSAMKENLQALNSDNIKLRKELDAIIKSGTHVTKPEPASDTVSIKEISDLRAKVSELEAQLKQVSLLGDAPIPITTISGEFPRSEILRRAALYSPKLSIPSGTISQSHASNPSDDLLDIFGSAPLQPLSHVNQPSNMVAEASLLDLNEPSTPQAHVSQDALLRAMQELWLQHSSKAQETVSVEKLDDDSTEVMMYQLHIDELQNKVKDLTAKNSSLDTEIQQLRKQSSEQMRTVQSQLNFGKERLKLLEGEKSKLEDERDSALLKLSDSMKKLTQAQQELSIAQPRIQELSAQVNAVKESSDGEIKELKDRIKRVEADLIAEQKKSKLSAESDLEAMRQKYHSEIEATKLTYEDRLKNEVENYMLLQTKLQVIMIEKEEKELDNRTLTTRIEELGIKISQKDEALAQGFLLQTALQKNLEELQTLNAEQSNNIDGLTARIRDFAKDVDALKQDNADGTISLAKKEAQVSALAQALQLTRRSLIEIKSKYRLLHSTTDKDIKAFGNSLVTEFEKVTDSLSQLKNCVVDKDKQLDEKQADCDKTKEALEDERRGKVILEQELENQLAKFKETETKLVEIQQGKEQKFVELEDQVSAMKIKEKQLQQLAKDLKAQLQAEKVIRDKLEGSDRESVGKHSPALTLETIRAPSSYKITTQSDEDNLTSDDAATLALKIGELKAENFTLEDKVNSLELRVSRLIGEVNQREKTIQALKREKEKSTGAGPSGGIESSPNKLVGVVNTLLRKPLGGDVHARGSGTSET
eukprot:TRINITY_DN3373_c0_g1_i10.p1 TRINITY_DN3373_c0_g1~~TRINITY_DN3373_c0_g1_i10.p1  ORF type:complete len:852 (-),score=236.48 TRINITY_DN3373_c0_g1_i10:535-3090(-)